MNKRIQALKEKMDAGKLVKGVFINMGDPMVSEMAGFAGYDFVWLDAEHGPLGRQEILHHIMAAQGSGAAAILRVPGVDRTQLKAILDMGPDGLIFPFVNNPEIAEEIVRACSYPDEGGVRGQGPIRAIRYGLDDEGEYISHAYEEVFKIGQIETLEAYEKLDAIMDVKGFDSFFIGAADMGRSIKGTGSSLTVDEVIDDVARRVRARGYYMGAAIGPTMASAKRHMDVGVQWAVFGQDARILAEGLKKNLDALKEL